MFGGVIDRDVKDDLESRFCDDLYSFDVARRRWYSLEVKPAEVATAGAGGARKPKRKPRAAGARDDGSSVAGGDEEEDDADSRLRSSAVRTPAVWYEPAMKSSV